jgi:hypothetical protein
MVLQMTNGYLEAVVLANCDVTLFYRTADWLQTKMDVEFSSKTAIGKSVAWRFEFHKSLLVLRYDALHGIYVSPAAFELATNSDIKAFKEFTKQVSGL